MQGLVFDKPVAPVINKALEMGLVLINAGTQIIRFVPPLVISEKDVDVLSDIVDFYDIPVLCYGLQIDFQKHLFTGYQKVYGNC